MAVLTSYVCNHNLAVLVVRLQNIQLRAFQCLLALCEIQKGNEKESQKKYIWAIGEFHKRHCFKLYEDI